jgi:hypothetical protein
VRVERQVVTDPRVEAHVYRRVWLRHTGMLPMVA